MATSPSHLFFIALDGKPSDPTMLVNGIVRGQFEKDGSIHQTPLFFTDAEAAEGVFLKLPAEQTGRHSIECYAHGPELAAVGRGIQKAGIRYVITDPQTDHERVFTTEEFIQFAAG